MTLINESGIWIITFKDNGVNKFWIGAAKNLNHILTHKLSLINKQCNTRMVTSLPVEIKELLRKDKEKCIEGIYAFTDVSRSVNHLELYKQDAIAKFLISKLLMEKGYESCVKFHEEWMHRNEDKFISLYPRFKQSIAQEEIGIYKASSTHYEICKDFGWEKSDFLHDLVVNDNNILIREEVKDMVKEYKENQQKDELDKLIEIDCILREITREQLIMTLISEKAYKLYNVLGEK